LNVKKTEIEHKVVPSGGCAGVVALSLSLNNFKIPLGYGDLKMKIRIEFLPRFFGRQYLLQILVVCVVLMAAHQCFCADYSVVQWRNNNGGGVGFSNESSVSVSRDLPWRKPSTSGVDSFNRDSQHVIPLPEAESRIVLAQHIEHSLQPPTTMTTTPTPPLPGMPVNKPVDPYEQERFKRNVPAPTPNPPTGATNTPLTSKPTKSATSTESSKSAELVISKKLPKTTQSDSSAAKSNDNVDVGRTQPSNPEPIKDQLSNNPNVPNDLSPDVLSGSFTPNSVDINVPTHDCKVVGFKPINEISCDIKPRPGQLPDECPLTSEPYAGRNFRQTCFQWKASAVCTKGAYFENAQLERYGHSVCPVLEPVISGVKFFTTIPILPYKAGLTPPNECVYTLGHYRVGNCAPHTLDPLPISVRAILFEGAAVAGAAAIIP
jgi:hypothetical protein